MEKKIKIYPTAHITVSGPTGCGKSAMLARIAKMIEEEFGKSVSVVAKRKGREPLGDALVNWETNMVKETIWVLAEED